MSKKFLGKVFHKGLFFSFFLCLFGMVGFAQGPLVIKAGTVHIGNGDVLRDVFVVVEDGKIVFVGKGYAVKPDVHVLDFSDKVLTPGFIAANARVDVIDHANEEGKEITPRMNVLYSVDPGAKDFDLA